MTRDSFNIYKCPLPLCAGGKVSVAGQWGSAPLRAADLRDLRDHHRLSRHGLSDPHRREQRLLGRLCFTGLTGPVQTRVFGSKLYWLNFNGSSLSDCTPTNCMATMLTFFTSIFLGPGANNKAFGSCALPDCSALSVS